MNMSYLGIFDFSKGTIQELIDICQMMEQDGLEVLGLEVWIEKDVKVYLFTKERIVEWIETKAGEKEG